MDPYYPSFYEGKTDEEAYREYFKEVGEYCDKLSNLLSCKLLSGTYSDMEVDALIKDGVIDEIAKTITEFRKEFP